MIVIISLWYGLAFFVNQKLKNKIYKVEKGDDRVPMKGPNDRVPILQLARSRSKKSIENETEI